MTSVVTASPLKAVRAPARRSSSPRGATPRAASVPAVVASASARPLQRWRQRYSVSAASQSNPGRDGDVSTARGSHASAKSASRDQQATLDPEPPE